MSRNLKKFRFTNNRNTKPFWIDPLDVRRAYRKIESFQNKLITSSWKYQLNIPVHDSTIMYAQSYLWDIDGYEMKKEKKITKIGKYKSITKYRYVVNNKTPEWNSRGIYAVPKLKYMMSEIRLKDSSGINPISL